MTEQVHWGHVSLAAVVVLLVMVASAGSSWFAIVGWIGAAAVCAMWCALLVSIRVGEARARESVATTKVTRRGR